MDSSKRTFLKAISWQVSGFVVMALIGYVATGSFDAAAGVAVASTAIGFVAFFLHERLWDRIAWGRDHRPLNR